MLQVFLRLKTTPQRTGGVIDALHALGRGARSGNGFLSCATYLEAGDPCTVCYEEYWESRPSLEGQMRGARYGQLLSLMEVAREQPTLEFREVTQTQGLEYLAKVRRESGK